MATAATATYNVAKRGAAYTYEVVLHNASPAPFDIYAFLFGWQFNVPITRRFPLRNIVFIRSPFGWSPSLATDGINYSTNFQGNAAASGYILPAYSTSFTFLSSTPPPRGILFGCCFYNGPMNQWGFIFNGIARLV